MLLDIKRVNKRFDSLLALSDCSFNVEQGEIIGLIGPNGAGKTTLFNLVTGFLPLDSGQILFKGENVAGMKPYAIARKGIVRTFQITRIFAKLTLLENLILPSNVSNTEERASELLDLAELKDLKDEYASDLSYGQQKLLSLMQALMSDPALILLDEPAAGINPTMRNKIINLIHSLNDMGKSFIIIEHDMDVIMKHCDRIIVLSFGEKIAEGTSDEIGNDEQVLKAYFGR